MNPNSYISDFLRSRIDAGDFPSAVYLVAEKGEIVFRDALGYAVVEPERIEARLDTIYDLASLTKVLVTALVLVQMIETGEFSLHDRISELVPAFDRPDKKTIAVKDVLAHTGGFPDWRPFYLLAKDRQDVLAKIAETPLEYEFGKTVIYSDPGFSIFTFLIEKPRGQPLDKVFEQEVARPLDLTAAFFNPPTDLKHRIAASEKGNEFERQMCVQLGYLQPPVIPTSPDAPKIRNRQSAFRNRLVWGEVHDGNAYFMGGVAGHAGLFSTVEEVFKIALQFLPNYTRLLKPETCQLFRTNFTKGLNEDRSFAFQLASTKDSTAGTQMSPESFGHNGFTGTSLWIDPVRERIFVLLTNRTHNHDLPFTNINSVRRRFHDLAIDALENKTSN